MSETPLLSVSCVVPAPSNATVLPLPIASALVRVSVPAVPTSSLPVEPLKLAEVAVLARWSFNVSLAPPPTVSVVVPVSLMQVQHSAGRYDRAPAADSTVGSGPGSYRALAGDDAADCSLDAAISRSEIRRYRARG